MELAAGSRGGRVHSTICGMAREVGWTAYYGGPGNIFLLQIAVLFRRVPYCETVIHAMTELIELAFVEMLRIAVAASARRG